MFDTTPGNKLRAVLKIVLSYLLLGPPIGCIALWLFLLAIGLFSTGFPSSGRFPELLAIFAMSFFYAYIAGGIQAIFVGIVCGVWFVKNDILQRWIPLAAGFLAIVLCLLFSVLLDGNFEVARAYISSWQYLSGLLLVHLIPAYVVWLLLAKLRLVI